MNSPRLSLFQFGIVLAVLLLFFGISAVKLAFAVTSEEMTSLSEGLGSNSGMIVSAAELAWLQPGRPIKFLIYMLFILAQI